MSERIHVIVGTHTARHLRLCLMAVARQTRRADSMTVSCDGDVAEVERTVREAAAELGIGVRLVMRAHTGKSRSSQVRNNGVRAIAAGERDLVVFLDGDIALAPDALATYARIAEETRADLLIGFRFDLSEEQTARFDEDAMSAGRLPVTPTAEQRTSLAKRDGRLRRQLLLRRFGLAKEHKPKLLSANFAVRFGALAAVNGFDEAYEGYGQEDDDLGRRLFQAGCRTRIVALDVLALHLHHPTRAPGAWHESPNAERFLRGGPARCALGIDNPANQPEVRMVEFGLR